jgi:hypothetical protein
MKLRSRLALTLLIAPICHARQIPAHVQEIVPTIEIEIIPEPQPENPKQQAIILGAANILANAAAIAGSPHDRQNVGQAVTGILANIINIALISGKRDHRSRAELFNIICDELHLDDTMREIVKQKIEELNHETSSLE